MYVGTAIQRLLRTSTMATLLALRMLAQLTDGQAKEEKQTADPHAGHHMPASEQTKQSPPHNHSQMADQEHTAGMYLMNLASGTSANPQSWPMPMLMPRAGSWNLMVMGQA